MTDIEFDGDDVPADDRPELESALAKLVDPASSAFWTRPPGLVTVRRKLSGLGGATVLEILIDNDLWVVKVDTVERMRAEHGRYKDVIESNRHDLFPEIKVVTPRVTDPSLPDVDEREVIAYIHLAHHVGEPEASLTTLEDVFTRASLVDTDAAERATAAVASALRRARTALYKRATPGSPASLRDLADTLGPDITVAAESSGADAREIYEKDVNAAGTIHPGSSATPAVRRLLVAGDRIRITGLERRPGTSSVGQRREATVTVKGGPSGSPFTLTGRVEETRPVGVMERLSRAVPSIREGPDVLEADGVTAAHPFSALYRSLFELRLPAMVSPVHGDLNARNVLLVESPLGHTPDDRPYLIDYARAAADGHLLADFAWLEINLMRAVGGDPGVADLVRLQRFLTAVAWLFPAADQGDRAPTAAVTGADASVVAHLGRTTPGPATIWPVLARLRWEAWSSYPEAHRDAWFADYNRHLTVAAHRTFKWPDAQQSPVRWAASAATAAVAAEWFDPAGALRHWTDEDLAALVLAVPRITTHVGDARAAIAMIAGSANAEVNRRRTRRPPATDVVGTLAGIADTLAASVAVPPPPRPRGPFIDLSVAPVIPEAPEQPTDERVGAVALLTREPFTVLVAESGAGKSTVVRVLADRMRTALFRTAVAHPGGRRRLPVVVPVPDVLATTEDADLAGPVDTHAPIVRDANVRVDDLLRAGCLHVLVDGVVAAADLPAVVAWATAVRVRYPDTPVAITSRFGPDTDQRRSSTGDLVTVFRLLSPTIGQAVQFLTESAALGNVPVHRVRGMLLAPETRLSAELLTSPLFLDMLAAHLRPDAELPTVGDLLGRHFAAVPAEHGIDADRWAEARRRAAALAAYLVDHSVDTVPDTDEPDWLDPPDRAGWPATRADLVKAGVLASAGAELGFTRPVYRDFHAAADLVRRPGLVAGRARRLGWQEPLRLATSRGDAPAEIRAVAVAEVRRADPEFAARLLATSGGGSGTAHAFATDQRAVLADADAGDASWNRAARALTALGRPDADLLHEAITDPGCPPAARRTAMLVVIDVAGHTGRHLPDPSRLAAALLADASTPPDLLVTAVGLAEKMRATRLALLIAGRWQPDAPWAYVRAARGTLLALDVPMTEPLRVAYVRAARARLAGFERMMPELSATDRIEAARREWYALLREATEADVDTLLRQRFTFDLDRLVGEALDRVAPGLDPGDDVGRLLTLATADEAVASFVTGDDRLATAAAHRLLSVAPNRAGDIAARVGAHDSPARMRAAAHAAAMAGRQHLPVLDGLAGTLLAAPDTLDRAHTLAVVISAVARLDAVAGARLTERARHALGAARVPARLHWPLRTALARHALPRRLIAEHLRSADPDDRALGLAGLSAFLLHLDASPPPDIPLDAAAVDALRSLQPPAAATWAVVDFVRAAATAGLTSALDLIHDLLDVPDLATMVREVPYGAYGVLSLTALSEVLTVAGLLVRRALLGDDRSLDTVAGAVAGRLKVPQAGHDSNEAGRLVALAQLGEPDALLDRLGRADHRLHVVARRAVLDLAQDGPYAGAVWRDPVRARDVVADLLYHRARTAAARTTLADIVQALVERIGELPRARDPRG